MITLALTGVEEKQVAPTQWIQSGTEWRCWHGLCPTPCSNDAWYGTDVCDNECCFTNSFLMSFYPLMKLKTILQLLITNVSYVLKNELLHRTLGIHSLPSMNLALDKKRLVVNKHILHEFVYCIDHTYMYVYAILYIQCTSYICYVVKVDFVISIIYTHLNHW